MQSPSKCGGFTLIELLIVIAIIAILVSIAIPSYHLYTRRAHYTEVVQAAAPYKLGVQECFHLTGALIECDSGKHGVPTAIPTGTGAGLVSGIAVDAGTITVVPRDMRGINSTQTYVLVPTISNNTLTWISGGGGVESGFAN